MTQINNPLHGMTLEQVINSLVDKYGWDGLGYYVNIRCFTHDPSVKSSLKFLRKTPWAREKVEALYVKMVTEYYISVAVNRFLFIIEISNYRLI